MNPQKAQALKVHVDAIAILLYEEANQEKLKTLAGIEKSVRNLALEHVMPQIGIFGSKQSRRTAVGRKRQIKSILGKLRLTNVQAIRLSVKSHTRLSPYLESCCGRASANVS